MEGQKESQLIVLANVENDNLKLDTEALYMFMKQPEIEGRPLVVISIAGAFRSGKSFILNFFLRYLRNRGWENKHWFGNDDAAISGGFPFKSGSEACTQGITVWPEVFSVPTNNGKQAAVIIVDTQGLFDGDTSPDINAKLMSISTLFSSHQILNIMRHLEERDLEHLQLCIAYAKAASTLRGSDGTKPFQKLTFLVRDWEHGDGFGDGTEQYLHNYFEKKSKSPEVQKVKESIPTAFDEVACTLLPHPGKKVARPKKGCTLTNEDIDEEFREYASEFVSRVLHPKNLTIKRSGDGREETAVGLMNLLGTVRKSFQAGKLPKAETLLTSVVRASNTAAMLSSVKKYKENMEKNCKGILTKDALDMYHRCSLKIARDHFCSEAKMGDERSKPEFLQQLESECNAKLDDFTRKNNNLKLEKSTEFKTSLLDKRARYERIMKELGPSVSESSFKEKHEECKRQAMSDFDNETRQYIAAMPCIKTLQKKLSDSISSSYDVARKEWEKKQLREARDYKDKIVREFEEEVTKYETEYFDNLESILENLVQQYVRKYDTRLASNDRRDPGHLQKRLNDITKNRLKVNEMNLAAKSSKFKALLRDQCISYEKNMKEISSSVTEAIFNAKHKEYRRQAMSAFDAAIREYKNSTSGIAALQRELSESISSNYEVAKEARRGRLEDEIMDKFKEKVRKYEPMYYKGLESILDDLQRETIEEFKLKLASCGTTIPDTVTKGLDEIKQKCLKTNHHNLERFEIFEGKIRSLGNKYAQEFKGVFEQVMDEAHVKDLDSAKSKFMEKVQEREEYKVLPDWAKASVENEIKSALVELKVRNDGNKNFRSIDVTETSWLDNLRTIWSAVKKIGRFIAGIFN